MKRQQQQKQKNNSISAALHSWYRQALKHTKYRWVVILGTLLYLVSPLDISPDVFPILGWIDDGLIASLLVTEVSQLMTEGLKRRRVANTTNSADNTLTTEVETVADADNIKTINVKAVSVS